MLLIDQSLLRRTPIDSIIQPERVLGKEAHVAETFAELAVPTGPLLVILVHDVLMAFGNGDSMVREGVLIAADL